MTLTGVGNCEPFCVWSDLRNCLAVCTHFENAYVMDQQILSLLAEQKVSDLEHLLKRTTSSELTCLIDKRALKGKGDPAVLVRAIFSGSPPTTSDGVQRRLVVMKHVISLFQGNEMGSKLTAELTGLLLSEMDAFSPSCLVELANFYIDGIKNGTLTSSKCLELFPKVLSTIEAKPILTVENNEMKGVDCKSHILNSLCSCRWSPDVILHIIAMLRDVSLSVDELGHIIAKTLRNFADMEHEELPPLVYQLLLLSTKGHKKMVLDGVIAHFVQQDDKRSSVANHLASNENEELNCDDISVDQLHHTEGTVILHITFAVKQDQQLGREFVKYYKANQQFSLYKVLSPFTSALALSIGRIHSFEEQIFELLKSAIIKSYRDAERLRLSHWVGDMVSEKRPAAAEQILDTIKNSDPASATQAEVSLPSLVSNYLNCVRHLSTNQPADPWSSVKDDQSFTRLHVLVKKIWRNKDLCNDKQQKSFSVALLIYLNHFKISIVGWDHITQGLVQLGFALMESFGPRASFGKVTSAPSNVKSVLLTPTQAACRLGVQILQDTFRVHESARAEIVDRLLNSIVTRASAPVSHYLELLSTIVKSSPRVLLDCLPRLREAFDYFLFLPIITAEGFLLAIQPLLKLSPALQDSLVLVLRKAVFSRQVDARRVAVSGFLMLLNNFRILSSGLSLSQQSSQSIYSSSSQIQVDVHMHRSESLNEALCLEILSTLRRSLTQQADIRLVLYEGLFNIIQSNIQLGSPVIGLLADQFQRYYEVQPDINPPVKLDPCIVIQGDQPYVVEPLGHLLESLCSCIFLVRRKSVHSNDDDFDKENCDSLINTEKMLESLIERMLKCEPEDFELDKSADFSALTSVGVRNSITALLVSGVYEVLMEYTFISAKFRLERLQKVVKFFQNYQCIYDVLKEKPANAGAAAGKKKGRPNKDVAPNTSADMPLSGKSGSGLLSLGFISSILTAIYSDDLPQHQEGVEVLRTNIDIQRHLVSAALVRLQQISQQGRCDGISGNNKEKLVKYCIKIGCVLLKQYSSSSCITVSSTNQNGNRASAGESSKHKALISVCLDGFAQATSLFCTRFSDQLWHYLHAVGQRNGSEKSAYDDAVEQDLIHKLIQRVQRMIVSVLTAVNSGDDRPPHDAAVLLGVIKQLSQLLETSSTALSDLDTWLQTLCREQSIDDLAVVKALLQQLLIVARRRGSAVELCRDIARDVHCCLGDIDQEVEIDVDDKTYSVVNAHSSSSCVLILTTHLETEMDDLEWIVTRMKAELTESVNLATDSTQRESAEKSICNRLGHVINTYHELLQAAVPIGPCIDAILRTVNRLYLVLTSFAKLSLSMYLHKLGHMVSRFEKLVKLSAVNLTPYVYTVITYVQTSQSEQLQADSDKSKKRKKNAKMVSSSDQTRVLKETKSIPNLIYAIEQYEKYLIQLSKKSKIDLTAHFKMSTSRDFRINAASLQAAIERDQQSDVDEDDAAEQDPSDGSDKEEGIERPSKKQKAIPLLQPEAASRKNKLSKK